MDDESLSIISRKKENVGYFDRAVELKSLNSCLRWICVDQSNLWKAALSWSIFFLLAVGSPLVSHFLLLCSACDENHQRPYDAIVQSSLSVFATISFLCLSTWARKYGINRFLFLDKLSEESERVQLRYAAQLRRSMKLLCTFVLPVFAFECAYRIWWYATGASEIPYYLNIYFTYITACTLQLCSCLYRVSIYILVCILYRLICYLQIFKMDDFAQVFQEETEVGSILKEHLKIRRNLKIISHRFRGFILLSLVLVTVSQSISLIMTTRSSANNNIFEAGELALCSISLVTGLFICLRSATKITHRAQSITSLAAKWHVCATINSFDNLDGETPTAQTDSSQVFPVTVYCQSDEEEVDGEEDDDIDNTKMFPIYTHTISFQKRQALVTYMENNRAGITVFGFMLDRTWLHTIFGIELALLLWLLNKTIAMEHVTIWSPERAETLPYVQAGVPEPDNIEASSK